MSGRSPAFIAALFMVTAVFLFALMDALLKLLSPHYPAIQVATLRGAASWPLVVIWALSTVGWRALFKVRWRLHVLRGVLGVVMMTSFVYALRSLPLTTTYALFFVAPLLIAALSVPLLGEQVGPRRWVAIGIGLSGVIVVLRPTGEGVASMAGLCVLLAALGYSVSAITVRVLGRTDSTQAMVVWLMSFLFLGSAAIALPSWTPIEAEHGWLIAGIGVGGALGQICITEAFKRGEASFIAPFEYLALVASVSLDLTVWGVLPDAMTWIGATIIVVSGLYLLHREAAHAEAEHP